MLLIMFTKGDDRVSRVRKRKEEDGDKEKPFLSEVDLDYKTRRENPNERAFHLGKYVILGVEWR